MHYFVPKRCASTSKIMYKSRTVAEQAADQSYVERGVELWVYRCEYCGCWHLTSHEPGGYVYAVYGAGRGKRRSRKRGYKPRRR
ncbi:hypothetical protein [Bifidobacterium xylocopae]|uniref:Uncharacterized protein n=1 Tax=Bifidobacterium xylocopae TaxID=2493119 RepID=A0A366KCN8_9BIFI|nr:hypothetical protein [Bifidobacterium xylocopae]RBP98948.1 hypothetical protein CRD59_06545 [Bifidobacterium xylocopae]